MRVKVSNLKIPLYGFNSSIDNVLFDFAVQLKDQVDPTMHIEDMKYGTAFLHTYLTCYCERDPSSGTVMVRKLPFPAH